ncbi:hypothetical protein ACWCPF_27905 [Streptomyces sp. NPDC001858]
MIGEHATTPLRAKGVTQRLLAWTGRSIVGGAWKETDRLQAVGPGKVRGL